MTRHTSEDGLLSSGDPGAVALWNAAARRMASEKTEWTIRLRNMGVRLAHPDDGWVHEPGRGYTPGNPEKWLSPAYSQFDDSPAVGDVIALGWPGGGYRLVTVTEIRERRGILTAGGLDYHYEDTGRRAT